jgi:hypothetical protein
MALAGPALPNVETQLVKSLQAINDNHLDVALSEVDKLLRVTPDFRLAQLVKGDLLMAHAGVINNFGSVANAPHDEIKDLRDEARVRLQRVLSQSDSKLRPRFLWQMDAQQKYALVVDTSRSTLFVYENVDGEPRYVTDFYVTIGKLGADKSYSGDQRTPIGVYFIKSKMLKKQLADIYMAMQPTRSVTRTNGITETNVPGAASGCMARPATLIVDPRAPATVASYWQMRIWENCHPM